MNDARYPNISAIDNRLAELENEKQQLLALREALRSAQNERSVQTFTPEQKVALFRQRFRGGLVTCRRGLKNLPFGDFGDGF